MPYADLPFIFGETEGITSKDCVIRLPLGINNKSALLSAYAEAGHFPEYFGNNWDAFNDCLRDFSWTSQKRIIIAHDDLPLATNLKELSVYLDILGEAVRLWKLEERHELVVIFPLKNEATIARLMNES